MCSLLHVAKALHKDKKSVYNSRVQKKKKKKKKYKIKKKKKKKKKKNPVSRTNS